MPIVDIYCRTATHNQNTYTKLERQETACREYCQAQGLEVEMVHREVVAGTAYQNRKEVQHILKRCTEGAIQGVAVADQSRISRSVEQCAAFVAELYQYNATLYVVQDTPIAIR
jgi:DNA invertase Pin-like site-specific DNA recombinase